MIYDAALLADGETTKTRCPSCSGGKSREVSFRASRKGNRILGRCYRASCGYTVGYYSENTNGIAAPIRQHEYTGRTRALSDNDTTLLTDSLGLTQDEIASAGCRTDVDTGRIIFDIRAHTGSIVGTLARSYSTPPVRPKVLTYSDGEPHFPVRFSGQSIVLVEDIISAIKVSRTTPCAALLGTAINDSTVVLLMRIGVKNLYLALDRDASSVAALAVRKYSIFFREMQVLPVNKDPKDCTASELQQLLRGVRP